MNDRETNGLDPIGEELRQALTGRVERSGPVRADAEAWAAVMRRPASAAAAQTSPHVRLAAAAAVALVLGGGVLLAGRSNGNVTTYGTAPTVTNEQSTSGATTSGTQASITAAPGTAPSEASPTVPTETTIRQGPALTATTTSPAAPSSTTARTLSSTLSTTPPSAPLSVPSPTAVTETGRCTPGALTIIHGKGGVGMGHSYSTYVLTNVTGRPCFLDTGLDITFLDAGGNLIFKTPATARTDAQHIVLQPGNTAHFTVIVSNAPFAEDKCGPLVVASTIRIRTTGAFDFSLPYEGSFCSTGIDTHDYVSVRPGSEPTAEDQRSF